MKKILKKIKLKNLVMILCGIIIGSSSIVIASILSSSVSYTKDDGTNTNVKDSLDELFDGYYYGDAQASDIMNGKTALVQGEKVTGTYTVENEEYGVYIFNKIPANDMFDITGSSWTQASGYEKCDGDYCGYTYNFRFNTNFAPFAEEKEIVSFSADLQGDWYNEGTPTEGFPFRFYRYYDSYGRTYWYTDSIPIVKDNLACKKGKYCYFMTNGYSVVPNYNGTNINWDTGFLFTEINDNYITVSFHTATKFNVTGNTYDYLSYQNMYQIRTDNLYLSGTIIYRK